MGKSLDGKELGQGIVQKKSGRYEARFVDRFGKRKSISGRNLKEVKKKFNESLYDNEKEINIRDNIKLDDWYEKWMDVYKYNVIRDNTKRHYNHVYKKHISPYLGRFYIKDITQLQIRELIKSLDKRGYQYETQNKVRVLLLDLFNKAMIDEFINKNPAKGITVRRNEKDIVVLSLEEQNSFFECCKGTFYDNFFNAAVSSGMRIGELAALRWEDVDIEKKVIHVKRTLVYQKYDDDACKTFHFEEPKTKASKRDIPINRQCEIALKKQYMQKNVICEKAPIEKKPDKQFQDLLFTTKYNTPLNSQIICDAIKKIVAEVNLMRSYTDEMETFSCHCFRHTFATRCFESGIQPKTVQSYLGHSTLQMTMDLYTSVLSEHMSSEMEKLDKSMGDSDSFMEKLAEEKFVVEQSNKLKNVIKYGDCVGS